MLEPFVTQLHTPDQTGVVAWRATADDVWRTWEAWRMAPSALRSIAHQMHVDALDAESGAATALAFDGRGGPVAPAPS